MYTMHKFCASNIVYVLYVFVLFVSFANGGNRLVGTTKSTTNVPVTQDDNLTSSKYLTKFSANLRSSSLQSATAAGYGTSSEIPISVSSSSIEPASTYTYKEQDITSSKSPTTVKSNTYLSSSPSKSQISSSSSVTEFSASSSPTAVSTNSTSDSPISKASSPLSTVATDLPLSSRFSNPYSSSTYTSASASTQSGTESPSSVETEASLSSTPSTSSLFSSSTTTATKSILTPSSSSLSSAPSSSSKPSPTSATTPFLPSLVTSILSSSSMSTIDLSDVTIEFTIRRRLTAKMIAFICVLSLGVLMLLSAFVLWIFRKRVPDEEMIRMRTTSIIYTTLENEVA